jgi:hypothetical protein
MDPGQITAPGDLSASAAPTPGGPCGSFCFQPPTPGGVLLHSASGPFDSGRTVTVTICQLTAGQCKPGAVVAAFLSNSGINLVKSNAAKGFYHVKFNTKAYGIDPAKAYRIRVLSNALELGFKDTTLPATGKVEVRFRIEK